MGLFLFTNVFNNLYLGINKTLYKLTKINKKKIK